MTFSNRIDTYLARTEASLDRWLPAATTPPERLHEAMRYAVLGGGKRVRPLLTYATGEALGVRPEELDAPATAIEFLHAFSLVHDDLPAMDDDDLRRGRPTTHVAFDEATAILAADALQPLAFGLLARHPELAGKPEAKLRIIDTVAQACGSEGMTGGQAMDLAAEGKQLSVAELENMHALKTGCLLWASVMSAAYLSDADEKTLASLSDFAEALGLAFQIRDDVLDIEGSTEQIGKPQGADEARDKATYPALLGIEKARERSDELLAQALQAIEALDERADGLRWLGRYIVLRDC